MIDIEKDGTLCTKKHCADQSQVFPADMPEGCETTTERKMAVNIGFPPVNKLDCQRRLIIKTTPVNDDECDDNIGCEVCFPMDTSSVKVLLPLNVVATIDVQHMDVEGKCRQHYTVCVPIEETPAHPQQSSAITVEFLGVTLVHTCKPDESELEESDLEQPKYVAPASRAAEPFQMKQD